jgi:hypothetical protein
VSLRTTLIVLVTALLATSSHAGSLTAMRFSDGWYLYGAGDDAVAGLRLPHPHITRLEVGQKMALVQVNSDTYLYGAVGGQIVGFRLPHHFVNSLTLGEDIAVVQSQGRTYLHALTPHGFASLEAPRASAIRVSGRVVLMSSGGRHTLYGASDTGVASAPINGRPTNIQLGREVAVLQFSGAGTHVVGLGRGGFRSQHASNGHPSNLVLPAAKDRESGFDALHARE